MKYYVEKNELEVFYFNNVSNTNFGLIVEEVEGLYDSFERDIEFIEVPGREGELIIDNNRVKSKDLIIKGYVDSSSSDFTMTQLKEGMEKWLHSSMTYQKLEFIKEAIGLKALCYKFVMKEIMEDLCEIEIKFRVQGENQ
ncbi:hypothetical protein [Romboutsia ilealis]|uniref:hypothetical protein n=1 Tax=Romboutsia ilealis TaxID=1115758 RepID=UPI0023F3E0A5|nr:hypothetical protein [Romboutsia ilealis]